MGFTHSVYVVPNPVLAMRVDKENLMEIKPASLPSSFTGREHSGSFLEGRDSVSGLFKIDSPLHTHTQISWLMFKSLGPLA